MQNGFGLLGGIGLILYLLMMLGMVAGYVVIIIAIWRGMKAHESIAETIPGTPWTTKCSLNRMVFPKPEPFPIGTNPENNVAD